MGAHLTRLGRLLLWSYERGSLAYDALCLLVLLFLLLTPGAWLADPMAPRP
jgi:hypothetical protein